MRVGGRGVHTAAQPRRPGCPPGGAQRVEWTRRRCVPDRLGGSAVRGTWLSPRNPRGTRIWVRMRTGRVGYSIQSVVSTCSRLPWGLAWLNLRFVLADGVELSAGSEERWRWLLESRQRNGCARFLQDGSRLGERLARRDQQFRLRPARPRARQADWSYSRESRSSPSSASIGFYARLRPSAACVWRAARVPGRRGRS